MTVVYGGRRLSGVRYVACELLFCGNDHLLDFSLDPFVIQDDLNSLLVENIAVQAQPFSNCSRQDSSRELFP